MQNSGQETPYQKALQEHPPIDNGRLVKYESNVPAGLGKILGHSGVYDNNVFQRWVYTIVPYGMEQNGHIMMTVEVPQEKILMIGYKWEEYDFTKVYFPYIPFMQTPII